MWLLDLIRRRSLGVTNYRLDCNPSEYYSSQFDPDNLLVVPIHSGGHVYGRAANGEQAVCDINGPVNFQVCLPCENREVAERHIEIAKKVLDDIVELDRQARDRPRTEDYREHLAYIEIEDDVVQLHYFASTMNTEWGAYFYEQPDGTWVFKHLG